jgi:hypothetical protein
VLYFLGIGQIGKSVMAIERVDVWDEIDEFLISAPTPEQIVAFRPSEIVQERVRFLLERNREGRLTADEHTELEEHSAVENFMRRLKLKALTKLQP